MLRSPQDTHGGHLRNLIDQRSTRVDIRGRFSDISGCSVTPSGYSRPFFSPKSSDNHEHQANQSCSSPTSVIPLHHDDYTLSMLDLDDLDDNPRSSLVPSEFFNIGDTGYKDEGTNSSARMSYLGPKMRFHSRAPWEVEDDTLETEAEPEGHRPFHSVFPFRGAKSATSSSSSPRPSYTTSRPSGESSRSQVPPKRSFETINSQISYTRGTFYTQESTSSYSLGRSTPPAQKEKLCSKFSLGRFRSESSAVDLSPSSNPSPGRSPLNDRFPPSPLDNDPLAASIEGSMRTAISHRAKGNSAKIEEIVHPYANPDLVISCIVDRPLHSPLRPTSKFQQRACDDANIAPSESRATDSISRSDVQSTVILDTKINTALPKHRISSIQARNISSPVSIVGVPRRIETPLADNRLEQNPNPASPGVNNLPGWIDPNAVPTFSLISLEEARAQRMRSATANPTSKISSPAIETEAVPGADSAHVGGSITRARARSISAGASKARSALQTIVGQPKPERRDSEPTIPQSNGAGHPAKTLKHKKSGFMRLFNPSKAPEKDERKTSAPVPSLPDSRSINHVQRSPRSSIHHISLPRLSPSSSVQSSGTPTSDTQKQSAERTPASLSINTQPPVVGIASASVLDRQNQTQASSPFAVDRHWKNDQAAPANVSEFPALKLRPMSTLFSANFGNHIVPAESSSSSEIVSPTPRSPSPRIVTLTPASATRASHEQLPIISSLDDQASVVRSLQEQLATAKKAWQLHIWELEGQVRDLKATVEELKGSDNKDYCQSCKRGKKIAVAVPHAGSVVHRPRARTGTSSRFTNALP